MNTTTALIPSKLITNEELSTEHTKSNYPLRAANVSSVPQRSPFRYPGGKTWLIPQVRQWLRCVGNKEKSELIEPFAGGAVISLTAVMEGLVMKATLVELDKDIADVWRAILGRNGKRLADQIRSFKVTNESLEAIFSAEPNNLRKRAFRTILKNRVNRNGIVAPGAGRLKRGEDNAGVASRWYPSTLGDRIEAIVQVKSAFSVKNGDGLRYMLRRLEDENAVYFIDPPYAKVGERLYRYGSINHERLFERASKLRGSFLMTYNDSTEIRNLADKYGFEVREILMNCGREKIELLISDDLSWLQSEDELSTHDDPKPPEQNQWSLQFLEPQPTSNSKTDLHHVM